MREPVQRIDLVGPGVAVKGPAGLCEREAACDELDDGVEAFEQADDARSVRPGAAGGDVEDVAVAGGGEGGGGVRGDVGAELGGLAPEVAVSVGLFQGAGAAICELLGDGKS